MEKQTGISREFVTYELAVRLKALGFDEPCMGYRTEKGSTLSFKMKITNSKLDKEALKYRQTYKGRLPNRVAAPLWQQAFRWFQEKGFDISPPATEGNPWFDNQAETVEFGIEAMQIKQRENEY